MEWLLLGGRSGTYGINLSKHIRNGWENFSGSVRFEVGNGINIFFWHELWCRDVVLKGAFPDLYRISQSKVAYVVD